jgi:hypothetical protein
MITLASHPSVNRPGLQGASGAPAPASPRGYRRAVPHEAVAPEPASPSGATARTPHQEVCAAIAEEIARLLSVDSVEMVRYEDDRVAVVMAGWGALTPVPIGTRVPLGGRNVTSVVFRTGRAARLDASVGRSPSA